MTLRIISKQTQLSMLQKASLNEPNNNYVRFMMYYLKKQIEGENNGYV